MNNPAIDLQLVRVALQQIWGYEDFRYPQAEIVRSLLALQDASIVLPTGGGKSLCFQLPALLQTGLTLVVSPLVALMENQVRELQQRSLKAALLHNELSRSQCRHTLQELEKQQLKLLYLSPETLLSPSVWERLLNPQLKINGLILDEAHCLVHWGDTFRPVYRRLGAVRPALLKTRPSGTKMAIAAFTATADTISQQTIASTLGLKEANCFCLSPYRDNLNLQVNMVWTPKCRRDRLLNFIGARKKQSGLIYVRTRRDSEELAQWLRSRDYQTAAYHAGLSPCERRYLEAGWLEGKIQFVVCTNAFGMGINKPDVRWIVHFQAPLLLSEYLQEVGRGGRDGKSSEALTLVSEPTGWLDPQDKERDRYFLNRLRKQSLQARQIARKIPEWGNIRAIAEQFPNGEIALSLLHAAGCLEWCDPFHYQLKHERSFKSETGLQLQERSQRSMKQYLMTRKCRWQFLLAAFGFEREASDFRCGHCDNCR
jgi:ATP-dependent DNA helicase RecQ